MKDFKIVLKNSKKTNKRLMVIFPHPDDESMATGGLLSVSKKYGWETHLIILTKGGAGKIFVKGRGKSLKEIRQGELKKAARILRVDKLKLFDFTDSKLKSNKLRLKKVLENEIKKVNPAIIITYDNSGLTGHPDHIFLSKMIFKILKEGRVKIDYYWVTFEKKLAKNHFKKEIIMNYSPPTHKLNLGLGVIRKYLAIRAHKSQKLGRDLSFFILFYLVKYNFECYHKVDLKHRYFFKYFDFEI